MVDLTNLPRNYGDHPLDEDWYAPVVIAPDADAATACAAYGVSYSRLYRSIAESDRGFHEATEDALRETFGYRTVADDSGAVTALANAFARDFMKEGRE